MPITKLSYLGGINKQASLGTIPNGQVLTINDLRLVGPNLVWSTGSVRLLGISSTVIGAGTDFVLTPVTGEYIVVNDYTNSKLQYYTLAASAGGSFTDITGAATIDNAGVFEILNSVLFYCGGTNGIFKWTGVGNIAAVGGSSPASANLLKVCNNFLFAGYTLDANSTIYWSNVADGTTWAGASNLTYRQNDGDYLRALSSLGQNLIIFKSNSIGSLSTQSTVVSGSVILGPLTTLMEGVGCIGPNAVDHLPDSRLVFLGSDNHAYIFDGSICTDISDQYYPGPSIQSVLGGSLLTYVRVYEPRREVWFINCSLSAGTGTAYVYNYVDNAWTTRTNVNYSTLFKVNSFFSGNTINGLGTGRFCSRNYLVSGDTSGYIYIEDTSGSSNPITSTPNQEIEFSIPVPADIKPNYQRFFVLPLKTASASQTVTYYTGRDGTYGSGTTYTTSGGWDRLKIAIPSSDIVTSFQVKITYSSTSVSITFDPAYVSDESVQ